MDKTKIRELFSLQRLQSFFMGRIYPIVVALLVTVGYFTGLELYFHFLNMALAILAMLICDSLRPIIIVVWTFVFQISEEHTPSTNNVTGVASDYYFTEWRVTALIISFVLVAAALVFFYVKNKLITPDRLRTLPHLVPSLLLAVAFCAGGAFSSDWQWGNFGFALVQCVMWFVIFYLMLIGLSKDNSRELVDYLVYVGSIVVLMLTVQLLEIFITNDLTKTLDEYGNLIRAVIRYGWGNTNTAAQSLTVTIPLMFLGVMRTGGKSRVYYLIMATVATVASILNMSRTALVVGLPLYVILLIVSFVKTSDKRRYGIEVISVIGVIVLVLLLSYREVALIIENYVIRGTGDSGRFKIWDYSILAFKENPIFGKGFFGLTEFFNKFFNAWSNTEFIPYMAHNTPVHMLGCCGAYGFIVYCAYRVCTAIPFIKNHDIIKSMLGTALFSVILGSLFENFLFYIMPMLSYSVIYAVAYRYIEDKQAEQIVGDDSRESND